MPTPVLEPRLQAVASQIRAETHADIGSDHALLPRFLLLEGRVRQVIVVEKNRQPFENARAALAGLNAEVRLGDGLAPLGAGEAESLSMSGMGALLMVKILSAHPEKLPARLVLQPNDSAEGLRVWARAAGFHLGQEQMVEGFWRYSVLTFVQGVGDDPAYTDFSLEPALRYGPLLLKQRHPLLLEELKKERAYLAGLFAKRPAEKLGERLWVVSEALGYFEA